MAEELDFEHETGWVAIPRSLRDESFYTDSNYVHLFLHLVLNMNRKDGIYKEILVKKHQVLTGRKSLSEKTGINESKVERILNKLSELGYIEQQKTNRYRLITILHRDCLNIFEQQKTSSEQQKTSEQQQKTLTTVTTSTTDSQSNKKEYGEFKNVLLSNDEYQKLFNLYHEKLDEALEVLSVWKKNKSRKSTHNYGTLLKSQWVYKKVIEQEVNGKSRTPSKHDSTRATLQAEYEQIKNRDKNGK